jgi:hypothetical protein
MLKLFGQSNLLQSFVKTVWMRCLRLIDQIPTSQKRAGGILKRHLKIRPISHGNIESSRISGIY